MKNFGSNVRQLRRQKQLSQEALALSSGLDRTYIGSVERGERNISLINIKRIADGLHIHTSELFSYEQ
ncbi:helix-turn-helix domain-containing protein [Pararhizobium sp. YC-54]|uniref:helix-turn-helix domain-containing protein n=1 Tax=Pararhizobium sp. YC-54 TaxID=2986920 RepID=UPI0021F7AFA0|nr:helix-turn-helix transcriptional regulator [Pararhizobium sp. YC-54]MCV9997963.1 helix-turn-helix domain-containing protein [Pararhizobium sp. YC-54]